MRIEELRDKRDAWPYVREAVSDAISLAHNTLDQILEDPDLYQHLERKFRKGEAEHGGAWLRSSDDPSWLIPEAAEEILDFILYQAMFVVLTEMITKDAE